MTDTNFRQTRGRKWMDVCGASVWCAPDEGGRQADFDPTAAPPIARSTHTRQRPTYCCGERDDHQTDEYAPSCCSLSICVCVCVCVEASLPDRAAGPGQDGQAADGEDAAPSSDEE